MHDLNPWKPAFFRFRSRKSEVCINSQDLRGRSTARCHTMNDVGVSLLRVSVSYLQDSRDSRVRETSRGASALVPYSQHYYAGTRPPFRERKRRNFLHCNCNYLYVVTALGEVHSIAMHATRVNVNSDEYAPDYLRNLKLVLKIFFSR
jgi:hypothetical protein